MKQNVVSYFLMLSVPTCTASPPDHKLLQREVFKKLNELASVVSSAAVISVCQHRISFASTVTCVF